MREAWAIFRKDTRRFWWEVLLTWVLLAWLARLDSWRQGFTPGSAEGWLNILLPFAWAYLIAIVVTEDALVGHRQFWLALPVRWMSILAAKMAFVIVSVHVPYLIASVVIVAARGFQPASYVSELLAKQLLLFVALTLPAMAIAATVRNVVQFMFVALAAAAALVLLTGGVTPVPFLWTALDEVRRDATFAVLAAGAITVAFVQYRRRRTILSRAMGLSVAVLAAVVYLYLPRQTAGAISCVSGRNAAAVNIQFAGNARWPADKKMYGPPNMITAALPIDVSGISDPELAVLDPVAFEIERPGGTPIRAEWPTPGKPLENASCSAWLRRESGRYWQFVTMDRDVFLTILRTPVTLRGRALVAFHNRLREASMPANSRAAVPGLGLCASHIVEHRPSDVMLDVTCESPAGIPRPTRVTFVDDGGRQWKQVLGDAMTSLSYPRSTWLSPVSRADTFFHVAPREITMRPGSGWLLAGDAIPTGKLVISGEPEAGCRVIRYELANVLLRDYVVQPSR